MPPLYQSDVIKCKKAAFFCASIQICKKTLYNFSAMKYNANITKRADALKKEKF